MNQNFRNHPNHLNQPNDLQYRVNQSALLRPTLLARTSGRQKEWLVTFAITLVALISLIDHFDYFSLPIQSKVTKWTVSALSIAMSVSFFALLGTVFTPTSRANSRADEERTTTTNINTINNINTIDSSKNPFIGSVVEGIMAIVTCGILGAVLPAMTDPVNDLAVFPVTGAIKNANLYFFTWGSFVLSFQTLTHYVREKRPHTAMISTSKPLHTFAIAAIVTTLEASRLFRSNNCRNIEYVDNLSPFDRECARTLYALVIGAVSVVVCWLWTYGIMYDIISSDYLYIMMLEALGAFLMLICWTVGVVAVTAGGTNAPGSVLGNLYFFTWGCFAFSLFTFSECITDVVVRYKLDRAFEKSQQQQEHASEDDNDGDHHQRQIAETSSMDDTDQKEKSMANSNTSNNI